MPGNIIKTRHLKIRLFSVGLCVMLASSLFASDVVAQEDKSDIDPYIDGNLSIARCIAKGNLDFITFLSAASFSDGFFEGLIEPWMDVLFRNQCHANDVLGLIKQRDKIRRYIRDAFLTCNTQKLPSLKIAFNKLNAEIYYVRHVVDGSVIVSLPFNLLSTRMLEDEESLYYPKDKLYSEMVERYVETGTIERKDFDQLFSKLDFKYSDRKKTYVICETDSWERVVKKWNEFLETAGGIAPAWKDLEKGVGGRTEKIMEAATDMGFSAYFKGLIQVNLNNMAFEPGFEEISENISDYLPNIDIPTQKAFLEAIELAEKKFDTELMRQNLLSNFESLYKNVSDPSVELVVTELDNLNKVILKSFDPLDSFLGCVEAINDRQCPM